MTDIQKQCKISSSGGCGTSFLISFFKDICKLKEPEDCQSYHLLSPPLSFKKPTNVIYVYTNPMNMISSFFKYNKEFEQKYVSNKSYSWAANEEVYSWAYKHCKDVFGDHKKLGIDCSIEKFVNDGVDHFLLEDHFDNWTKGEQDYSILYILYEKIPDYIEEMLKFVGVEPNMAKKLNFRPRKTDWRNQPQEIQEKLFSMFSNLNEKMDAFPEFLIKEGTNEKRG